MSDEQRRADWTDRIVGARMTIDDRYASTVEGSEFSRQEWGLIMTAVEFEIEHAADDERARLVADTSGLSAVMPELERVRQSQGGMRGSRSRSRSGDSGGFLGSMKDALGLGGGGADAGKTEAAEELAAGYAAELQSYLEEQGRWEEVRTASLETTGDG